MKRNKQFLKLIFRQYKRRLIKEDKKIDFVSNTIVKNYSNYFSVNKFVFNLSTQTTGLINVKGNKELPIPFNIYGDTKCNSHDYSREKQKRESESIDWLYRLKKQQQASKQIDIINNLNLFKQITNKYALAICKLNLDNKELKEGGKADNKWIKLLQKQNFIEGTNKASQLVSKPVGLLLPPKTSIIQLMNLKAQEQFKNILTFEQKALSNKTNNRIVNIISKQLEKIEKNNISNELACSLEDNGKVTQVEERSKILRILKNLFWKQNTNKFENGFSNKNNYRNNTELITTKVKQNRQVTGMSKHIEELRIKKLSEKSEIKSLILCKPHIADTAMKTGQIPKEVLLSDKEVYAKAVTSSRPNKNINDIGTEEVNILAERILKVLEKKKAIQKDRRGIR